jgi:Integrase core domain
MKIKCSHCSELFVPSQAQKQTLHFPVARDYCSHRCKCANQEKSQAAVPAPSTKPKDPPLDIHVLIGTIRRECLDHMIVFGQAHLRRVLGKFAAYYNESRIHRSLDKDTPFHRAIERVGAITSQPVLGGLHHQYCRI